LPALDYSPVRYILAWLMSRKVVSLFMMIAFGLTVPALSTACQAKPAAGHPLRVLAVETFLADITQNVAGDRLKVAALMPLGADPHSFEPTPKDVARVADSEVLIVNGAGFEDFLNPLLQNAGGKRLVIEASAGLTLRTPGPGEVGAGEIAREGDPHFFMNPVDVIRYVENIRDGLSQADPAGIDIYASNAMAYIAQLNGLDAWIAEQISQIPPARRLLVTNHESLGYFADRYGLRVVGAIIPNVSSSASPSAKQMAALIDQIKATGAPAIFLDTGSNTQMAQQIASETGIKVISDLYTHSVSAVDGPAPTYIDLMRYNVKQIVEALK
jgi:ABC-type Zn uptake system ZnuABC Zn-binding protein ZnuA